MGQSAIEPDFWYLNIIYNPVLQGGSISFVRETIIIEWECQFLKLCSNALIFDFFLGEYSPNTGVTLLNWAQENRMQMVQKDDQRNVRQNIKAS